MAVVALSDIDHDNKLYHKGQTITAITDEQAQALVDAEVAVPVKAAAPETPATAAKAPAAPAAPVPAAAPQASAPAGV